MWAWTVHATTPAIVDSASASLTLCSVSPDLSHVRAIFVQTATALHHLHSIGVHHGDIKPENVLVALQPQTDCVDPMHPGKQSKLRAILCDLGHSKHGVTRREHVIRSYGTRDLYSPELLWTLMPSGKSCKKSLLQQQEQQQQQENQQHEQYANTTDMVADGLHADVFALGMLLFGLLNGPGKLPRATSLVFDAIASASTWGGISSGALQAVAATLTTSGDPRDLIYTLCNTHRRPDWTYPFFEGDWRLQVIEEAPEAVDLVMRMLCVDPNRRITIDEVMRHPWVRKAG